MNSKVNISRIIATIFLLSMILSSISSCRNKQDVFFVPELSLHNYYEASDIFSFNILFLYTGDLPDIKLTSLEADGLPIEWIEFSFSSCDEFERVDGYQMGYVIIRTICNTDISISKAVFSVAGEEKIVNFSVSNKALKHTPTSYPDVTGVIGCGIPFIINSVNFEISNIPFEFVGNSDISISSFDFTDFIKIEDADVYINDSYIGTINESLPIVVNKGSTLKIIIKKAAVVDYKYSDASVSFILKYKLEGEIEEREYFDSVHVTGITSQENFKEFVEDWEKEEH